MSNATVTITVHVRQDVEADVHVGDILQAVNELPLAQRMNAIAVLLRNIDLKHGDLTLTHCQLIVDFLQDKLSDFLDTLHVKKQSNKR